MLSFYSFYTSVIDSTISNHILYYLDVRSIDFQVVSNIKRKVKNFRFFLLICDVNIENFWWKTTCTACYSRKEHKKYGAQLSSAWYILELWYGLNWWIDILFILGTIFKAVQYRNFRYCYDLSNNFVQNVWNFLYVGWNKFLFM